MTTLLDLTNDPERWIETLRTNYAEWGPPLSVDGYVERERELDARTTAAGLAHRVFALADADGTLVAACEVLSRPLYYGDGRMAHDHAIASVFVPAAHRRRGHAERLVSAVTQRVHSGDDQVSLWSDVGDFYARCGFRFPPGAAEPATGLPPWQASLRCRPRAARARAPADCEWLGPTAMPAVIETHRRLVRQAANALQAADHARAYAAVEPHVGLYGQMQFRGLHAAKALGLPVPERLGARTRNGHGWIVWAHLFASKTLLVLGIYGSASETVELLTAAEEAAAPYEGFTVELYETTLAGSMPALAEIRAALDGSGLDVTLERRAKSLPMSMGSADWVCIGGYAWY